MKVLLAYNQTHRPEGRKREPRSQPRHPKLIGLPQQCQEISLDKGQLLTVFKGKFSVHMLKNNVTLYKNQFILERRHKCIQNTVKQVCLPDRKITKYVHCVEVSCGASNIDSLQSSTWYAQPKN